jgi:hypothetical protein
MATKLVLGWAITVILIGCSPETSSRAERRTEAVREDADRAGRAAKEEAERARVALSRRLDQLDEDLAKLDSKARKASAKARVKINEQAREMRAEAKQLRARMSTWDDKAESAWRTAKREMEQGLERAERSVRRFVNDTKD